jgi:hypothetical protein
MGAHMDETLLQLRTDKGGDMTNKFTAQVAIDAYNEQTSFLPADQVSGSVNQNIDATLDERGKRYGSYAEKAEIIQDMKWLIRSGSSWLAMDADMKESLEMIIHKIGRIVTGDPTYLDSWTDVIGYAKLVEDRLKGVAR